MKDDEQKRRGFPKKDPRQDRLKLALRENLKRRKSQARARGDATPSTNEEGPLHDGGEKAPGE